MSLRKRVLGLVRDVARFVDEVAEVLETPVPTAHRDTLSLDVARCELADLVTDVEIGPILAEDDTLKSILQTIQILDEDIEAAGGKRRPPVVSPYKKPR